MGDSKHHKANRIGYAGAALLLTLTAVAGCSTGGETAATTDDTIVWAVDGDAVGLDPQNAGQAVSQRILRQIYDTLLARDDGVEISPSLAAKYEQTGPTTYDFTLREEVKFSNGRALTADDVVGSFERLKDPDLGSYLTPRMSLIKDVIALDDATVRFELTAASTDLFELIADPAASIMPMAEIESGELDTMKETLGTGPYVVEEHQKDSSWKLTANPYYWKPGQPAIHNLEIQVLPDEGTRLAALRSGSADVITLANSDSAQLADSIPNVEQISQQNPDYYILLVNSVSAPALESLEARQGINLAIDRSKLNDIALGGTSQPVGPLPDCPADTLEFSTPDLDRARELLTSSGTSGPIKLTYDASGGQDEAALSQTLQAQLQEAGVQIELQPLPLAQYLDDADNGKIELALSFYTAGTYPYEGLVNWDPDLSGFTGPWNAPVADISENIAKVQTTTGDEKAQAIQAACAAIDADSAQIPLVSRPTLMAWRSDRIDAVFTDRENGGNPLRHLASFTEK